jgi:hypothetical protein
MRIKSELCSIVCKPDHNLLGKRNAHILAGKAHIVAGEARNAHILTGKAHILAGKNPSTCRGKPIYLLRKAHIYTCWEKPIFLLGKAHIIAGKARILAGKAHINRNSLNSFF